MASRAQIIETSHNTRASAAGECISSSDNEEEEQITEPGSSKPTEHRNTIAGIDSSASSASVVSGIERPTICRYFLTGSCRFGNWCRNLHSTESDSIQIPNNCKYYVYLIHYLHTQSLLRYIRFIYIFYVLYIYLYFCTLFFI